MLNKRNIYFTPFVTALILAQEIPSIPACDIAGPRGIKLTFQQSERQPRAAGPSTLLYLTARCRSARVEQCFRVISHLDLEGCPLECDPI